MDVRLLMHVLCALLLLTGLECHSQDVPQVTVEDTVTRKDAPKKETKVRDFPSPDHSPKKAAFYSLAFPGGGQIYNHKYWKLPIVYGGIGAGLYFVVVNSRDLRFYNDLLTRRLDPDQTDEFVGILSTDQITSRRDISRRNVELSTIVTGVLYLANIIDAIVDAHLINFDISDDLSMDIHPKILTVNNGLIPALGVTLRL